MQAYMDMKQYAEADEYLDKLEEDLKTVDTVLKTGNVMVDATAIVPQDISVSGVDLSVLIGNLLDNAMEACMRLPEQERFIRIYIDIVKKQLYISVTNSMAGRAKKSGGSYLTNKSGSHGLGLMRIDSIVSKYHGFLNRQTENGVFATEVMLPLTSMSAAETGCEPVECE